MHDHSVNRFTDTPLVQKTNGKHPSIDPVSTKGMATPLAKEVANLFLKATEKDIYEVDEFIRKHPAKSILYATLAGILMSKFLRR
jgi:hypothetical protein